MVMVAIPFSERCVFVQGSQGSSRIESKLTELVTSGQIPAAKVGKAVRISKAGLDAYMRRNAYTENAQD
jgi:excisionase family DNA binding protein